jgi:molybdopterin-binding protein
VAENEQVRIEVAFAGGQILGALVTTASADALERALAEGGDSALALEASDARYTIAVEKVVYVKRFARESRVGFGSG